MKRSIFLLIAIALPFIIQGKPTPEVIEKAQAIFATEYAATLNEEGQRRIPVNEEARIGMENFLPVEASEKSYSWYTGFKLFSGNLSPEWDKSEMHREYLIVPADMELRFGALRYKNKEDISPSLAFPVYQRIVVDVKNKRCYELFAIPEDENLPYDDNNDNLNVDDFDGVIIYADFTGKIVHAAKYGEGKCIDESASSDGDELGRIVGRINMAVLTSTSLDTMYNIVKH